MVRKRIAVLVGLLITVSLATAAPALAAAPGNDTFVGATVITSMPFSETIDTTSATTDPDDAEMNAAECGAPATDASVWYKVTPSADAFIVADVSSSNYSAGAIVATGSPGSFSFVTCGPGAVVWEATSGTTYSILAFDDQLDGVGTGGMLTINVQEVPPPPDVSITVNPRGMFDAHTGGARVSGTVTCTGDAQFSFIEVFMRQRSGRFFIDGGGFIEGFDCEGITQPWTVDIQPFNGIFKGGRTATVTFAFACGEFLCGEGFVESVVSLSGKKK